MDKTKMRGASGFTLIELMIVVAIIGALAAVAAPKFGSLIRKANEGASKGNLALIRAAMMIYYGDLDGQYPATLTAMTVDGKYLGALPVAKTPNYHADSSVTFYQTGVNDKAGWSYNNTAGDANQGTVLVNCRHTDSKGTIWSSY